MKDKSEVDDFRFHFLAWKFPRRILSLLAPIHVLKETEQAKQGKREEHTACKGSKIGISHIQKVKLVF